MMQTDLDGFLSEWRNDKPYVVGHTSGSTGKPKEILLNKDDMRASARLTNEFFGINENSTLLLCLSTSYIAGKMMVVRALESGAKLLATDVSSHPLKDPALRGARIDFSAMVPMQVEESLKSDSEKDILDSIKYLIIGGAAVSSVLEDSLKDLKVKCFATYGMTETVSHIALRELNRDEYYFALGDVRFRTDERQCLVIDAPQLSAHVFHTNDIVSLKDDRHFSWLGRYDNVINSGGIKFFPEIIEKKIAPVISERFFISSVPDERLGEKIILVIESGNMNEKNRQEMKNFLTIVLKTLLTSYEMPKDIVFMSDFMETKSGKVIRKFIPIR